MAITIVRGTDVGAPSLTGTVGALITLLDYLLVTTLGWTKDYSGTNLAAYRAATGNRFYLYVDDTNAFWGRINGYEAMSDIASGTNAFPTAAQISGGGYLNKANTAVLGVVGTDWTFISNGTIFYLFVNGATNGANVSARRMIAFGDFPSYKSGDAYNGIIICDPNNTTQASIICPSIAVTAAATTDLAGHYLTRDYTQISTASQCSKRTDTGGNFSGRLGAGSYTYPAPIEGGLLMAPIWIQNGTNALRGLLPGIWSPLHSHPLAHGDTFSGVGDLSGRTFETIELSHASGASFNGQIFIETSNTWSTS